MQLAKTLSAGIAVSGLFVLSCGLRQNMRNEFTSYRGAWHCPNGACSVSGMERATKSHRDDTVNITHANVNPRVLLAFYPGKPVTGFTAKVSCGGGAEPVPDHRIERPGTHTLAVESDSWIVTLVAKDYTFGNSCKIFRVTTTSTWEDGATYEEEAGIQVEK
jgi:hypothetical protein